MVQLANLNTVLSLESQSFLTGIEQSRGSLRKLLESLDPTAKAAARFNRDVAELDRGLKNGNLTVVEYDRAMALLRQRFDSLTPNIDRVTNGVARQRAAMQQLGFQLNDISTGLVAGTPPLQVFAQQFSQVTQAVQMMSTESKGFLSFLGGPWGAVLTSATVVVVGLASALLDGSKAAKEKEAAAKTLKSAIDSLQVSTERQISSEGRLRQATLATAEGYLKEAAAARQAAQDSLNAERSKLRASLVTQGVGGGSVPGSLFSAGVAQEATARRAIAELDKQLSDLRAQEASARDAVKNLQLVSLRAQGDAARSKGVKATTDYQAALDRLNDSYKAGRITAQQYQAQYVNLSNAYDIATEKLNKSTASTHRKSAADGAATKAIREHAKALKDAQAAIDAENESLQRTLDRLFPGRSELRQASSDLASLQTLYEQGKIAADDYANAYSRLAGSIGEANARIENSQTDLASSTTKVTAQLNFVNDELESRFGKTAKKAQESSETITQSYARMAQGVVGSLRGLADSISNGDILGVLDSVLSVVQGLFAPGPGGGKSVLGILGLSKRAEGGPVAAGSPYLIGERGPELFVPGTTGSVMSHEALRRSLGNGGGSTVRVVPSPYFDVVVDNRASGVVERAAPQIAVSGASGAVRTIDRRRDRALA